MQKKHKNITGLKLRPTVTQSIKAVLGWKFWIQVLFHEPEVLQVSLTHLVARIGWAHAKVRKEPTHTLQITLPQFLQKVAWAWAMLKRIK